MSKITKSLRPKIRPKNIGSTDSPSTRGQDPKDIYSEEDLKRLLESAGVKMEKKVEKKTQELLNWMKEKGLTPKGQPELARYNPPITPPFFRRNEVMISY